MDADPNPLELPVMEDSPKVLCPICDEPVTKSVLASHLHIRHNRTLVGDHLDGSDRGLS